jgi:hypothetical protein
VKRPKNIKPIINFCLIIFFAHPLICMDPHLPSATQAEKESARVAESLFIFLTKKDNPHQEFMVSLETAKRCSRINKMFENIDPGSAIHQLPLEDTCRTDGFEFVCYLQNIHALNLLPESEKTSEESTALNKMIAQQIKTLRSPQLVDLFMLVSRLDMIDKKGNHHHLTKEVTKRILSNPLQVQQPPYSLDQQPLLSALIEKINEKIDLKKKYTQPYADTLTQGQELDRTVSIGTAIWYNITNGLTAPLRIFSSHPWVTKTVLRPYYFNTKTGTIVTGFVQQGENDRLITLLITNKNTGENRTISLDKMHIKTIKNIEANTTESLFICRTGDKAFIIDTENEKSPIIDHDFVDCVFSHKDDELYCIKKQEFGVFNIHDNTFCGIDEFKIGNYTALKINKNKTNLALCYWGTTVAVWKNCNNPQLTTNSVKTVFKNFYIGNICLHPTEDLLYVQYIENDLTTAIKTAAINITTEEITHLELTRQIDYNDSPSFDDEPYKRFTQMDYVLQFLPDYDDILLCSSPGEDDYFINTPTNYFWSKKKNKNNDPTWKSRPEIENRAYQRIAFTTNLCCSLEQTIEGSMFINFLSLATGSHIDLSIKKIILAPLIDFTITQSIQTINNVSLFLDSIGAPASDPDAVPTEPTKKPEKREKMAKIVKIVSEDRENEWLRRIFAVMLTAGSIGMKIFMHVHKNNTEAPASTKQLFLSIVAFPLLSFCIFRIFAQY